MVDARSGAPVIGAIITIYHGNDRAAICPTKSDGRFLYRMTPEPISLCVRNQPRGYLPLPRSEAVPVALCDGKTVTVVLKLHPGAVLQGTVVDAESGKAIPGVGPIAVSRQHP